MIDVTQCNPASGGLTWEYGSEMVEVKGLQKNKCKFIIDSEVEMGGVIHTCEVPVSLKEVVITRDRLSGLGFKYSFNTKDYCVDSPHPLPTL